MTTPIPAQPARRSGDFEVDRVFSTCRRTLTRSDLGSLLQFAGLRLPLLQG